jgi:hypothetical protein
MSLIENDQTISLNLNHRYVQKVQFAMAGHETISPEELWALVGDEDVV